MGKEIKPNYRYIFLGHFFIALILGVLLLLFPVWFATTANWPYDEVYFTRITGALFLGFASGSILAFRETEWERVKIYVISELVWFVLGVVVNIYALIAVTMVFMQWVNVFLAFVLLGAFGWLYWQHK